MIDLDETQWLSVSDVLANRFVLSRWVIHLHTSEPQETPSFGTGCCWSLGCLKVCLASKSFHCVHLYEETNIGSLRLASKLLYCTLIVLFLTDDSQLVGHYRCIPEHANMPARSGWQILCFSLRARVTALTLTRTTYNEVPGVHGAQVQSEQLKQD